MAVVTLDGAFAEVNPALCRILGRSTDWLVGHGITDVLDDPDAGIDRTMRAQAKTGPDHTVTREHQMIRSDGQRIWVEHSVGLLNDTGGEPAAYVSQFVDVTEARQARERLRFLAGHDALTELLNRRELIAQIDALLTRTPRTGTNVAVLFIDLDGLKPINDAYGHAAGDTVIAVVARRLHDSVRADDIVARIGGDEFVVVLTSPRTLDDATHVAAKIHEQVAVPVHTDAGELSVTLSIGLAMVEPGDNSDSALHRADAALYQAKQQGRARTVTHTSDTAPTAGQRWTPSSAALPDHALRMTDN